MPRQDALLVDREIRQRSFSHELIQLLSQGSDPMASASAVNLSFIPPRVQYLHTPFEWKDTSSHIRNTLKRLHHLPPTTCLATASTASEQQPEPGPKARPRVRGQTATISPLSLCTSSRVATPSARLLRLTCKSLGEESPRSVERWESIPRIRSAPLPPASLDAPPITATPPS